jgi:micrococcal nuclease
MLLLQLLLSTLIFASNQHEPIEIYEGRVMRVLDGDSVLVMRHGRRQWSEIRMRGIDAPENGQPYAGQSRRLLESLVRRKVVSVVVDLIDFHGREVATLYLDGEDINLRMIEQGMAWFNRPFAGELHPQVRRTYRSSHNQARREALGLWADPNTPVAPWQYRWQSRRQKKSVAAPAPVPLRCSAVFNLLEI